MVVYSSTFDATKGYPGEGPPASTSLLGRATASRLPPRDVSGLGPRLSARPQRARLPSSRLSDADGTPMGVRAARAISPALSMDSDAGSATSNDTEFDYTPESLESRDARCAFISDLKKTKSRVSYWRRKFYQAAGGTNSDSETRGIRGFKAGVSQAAIDNRVRETATEVHEKLSSHPELEQAEVVARVIEDLSQPAREALRETSPIQIERYLAVRWAIMVLKEKWWTPYNWLELRLKKFISISTFAFAHRIFSKTENSEGRWEVAYLLPHPTPYNKAAAQGIYGPLRVPSPFRTPGEMARAQDVILRDHQVTSTTDGKGASFDPQRCAADCLKHARDQNNLREPAATGHRRTRLQILCDALGFYRGGRMATRFGIRCMDIARLLNSPYFFHNISIYLNGDKHKELLKYLGPVLAIFNSFRRSKPATDAHGKPVVDSKGQREHDSEIIMLVGDAGEECILCDGGDAAGGNAMAGLEPPPSKNGCCYYCELRACEWYDRAKCDAAKRRNLFRSCLMSHRLPPGVLCSMLCPACGYEVSPAQVKRDQEEYDGMSPTKQNDTDLEHRRNHFGEQYLTMKLIHSDHCHRALSLLHLMLNTVGSTLTVTVSAGATKAQRIAVNEVLEANNHQWRLKETKTVFEKKPAGNECRHFLWRPGDVLLKVLRARYGVTDVTPATAQLEKEVSGVQQAGAHHNHDSNQRLGATARPPPLPKATTAKAPAKRANVTIGSALGTARKTPPPPPPVAARPPPAKSTTPAPACATSSNGDEEEEAIEMEERNLDGLNETTPDKVVGGYASALAVVLSLLKMHLYLHDEWDDSTEDKRRVRGAKAQELGAAWTVAGRAHVGNHMRHYYNHIVFAHLAELIHLHGNLQSGNDEILEKGNRDVKDDKKLTFKGGASGEAGSVLQRANRWKTKVNATGEQEEFVVTRKRQRGVMESVLRNVKTREIQGAARMHPGLRQSAKVAAHNAAVRAKRDTTKKEVETRLEAAVVLAGK